MRPVTPFMMIPALRSRILAPEQYADVSTESYHTARMCMNGMRISVKKQVRTLNRGDPEQRLADGKVADDLGSFWIGRQRAPESDVLWLVISQAGKQQAGVAIGKVAEILHVVGVGPLGFVLNEGRQEGHGLLEADPARQRISPEIVR